MMPLFLGFEAPVIDVLQFFALFFAALWAVNELRLERSDRRVDASLEFAKRFTEGEVAEQRRLLDQAWYAHAKDVKAMRDLNMEIDKFQAFFYNSILKDRTPEGGRGPREIELRLAVAEIADTLDQLALCVKPPCSRGICLWPSRCDAPIAREHFCTYALSFTTFYAPLLDEIAQELDTPPLGKEAHAFATHPDCRELTGAP